MARREPCGMRLVTLAFIARRLTIATTETPPPQLVVARAGRRIDPRPGAVAVAASVLLVTVSALS